MAENHLFLTAKDRALIQRFLEKSARTPPPLHSGPSLGEDSQAPEVYIARAPEGGIEAMVGATPGRAVCSVVQLLKETSPSLISAAPTQEVYNISYSAVQPFAFGIINRDKFGAWVWVYTLAQTSDTEGFTGCKPVENACTGVTEAWHYVDGLLVVTDQDFDGCDDCFEVGTGTGTGTGTAPTDACPCDIPDCLTLAPFPNLTPRTDGGDPCDCSVLNVARDLRSDSSLIGFLDPKCAAASAIFNLCPTTSLDMYWLLWFDRLGTVAIDQWILQLKQIAGGFVHVTYTIANWTCTSPLVLNFHSVSIYACQSWPSVAVLTDCGEATGTGTSPADTGTGTISTVACVDCAAGIPRNLTLTIVSGCPGPSTPRALTYSDVLGRWETVHETVNGLEHFWYMDCFGQLGMGYSCGGATYGTNFSPSSCEPFDSGNIAFALAVDATCCGGSLGPVVRVTE